MNYIRISGGSMMPITFKSKALIPSKKQTSEVKPTIKLKKDAIPETK